MDRRGPAAGRSVPRSAASSNEIAACTLRRGGDPDLLPPEPAAAGAAAADGRRADVGRDQRRLPRLAARRAPPRRRRHTRGRARLSPGRAPAAIRLPQDDDGAPADRGRCAGPAPGARRPVRYVVVHPGASVRAPGMVAAAAAATCCACWRRQDDVVVTGGPRRSASWPPGSAPTCRWSRWWTWRVSSTWPVGRGDRRRQAIVVGNTGPAHLAAAVGTPVVSIFAPDGACRALASLEGPVRAALATKRLCAGCRARECPLTSHPCIEQVGHRRCPGGV